VYFVLGELWVRSNARRAGKDECCASIIQYHLLHCMATCLFLRVFHFSVCSNRSSRLLLHSVYLESCGVLYYLSTDAMLCLLVRLSKLSNLLSMGSRVSSLGGQTVKPSHSQTAKITFL
jgi:hypothetical protein